MFIEQPPQFIRWIWRGTWRMSRKSKAVYLTFDDGPCPETTPKLLDILDEYNVKATFFCVGDNVRKYPEWFNEYKKRGHAVGNHTMHHLKGFSCENDFYLADVQEADSYIKSRYFRPPYGRIKPKQLKALQKKYRIIMWDVITRDYNAKLTPEKVYGFVRHKARNGSVIVFHDSKKAAKNMLAALPPSIEWLKSQGYEFKIFD